MSNNKLKKRQARLFSTLASIEQTDRSASKRRKQSHLNSIQQSRAAADQTKLNGILLELRILTQRCLTEQEGSIDALGDGALAKKGGKLENEVDALLENLLVARRELMGHQLEGVSKDDTSEASDDDEEEKGVDYAKLINQSSSKNDEDSDETSSDDESSASSNSDDTLTKQLQNEYNSLQSHWKSILNKHHSNLALHSGMSVNNSKFQSRAVDVSFWEQVQSGMEHDRFKQRTASKTGGSDSIYADGLQFDDSKLYQQMLKDFISSSQATNGGASSTGKANKRGGMMLDPAQEAAERLKRAMRKKTGAGDVDLTSLLTESGATNVNDLAVGVSKKKTSTVDRRASKGRKIRYTIHPKLVNFTFPVSRAEPMISDDVWFKSLFGGVGKV
jgi:protein AATF/BFR2